jgi:hypothetical protein
MEEILRYAYGGCFILIIIAIIVQIKAYKKRRKNYENDTLH